ncbi:hypothetical protein HNQ35_001376 [Cerasibacillus quisquiliarum]|uniref:Uncharacterized protein n=1 Tax=Cerasibacillus quisquiliarum TaxID=227865 RepID=A0A511UW93_9BACI|nr:hypothetical protein [Cerasibacillus quisquiliarum]MBB5146175.1 hypothetical protein [Cerasibacillus quisquiliarum]GEN30910.1 hypothetical protein CQU01_11480 [Cerasibacillus quisquiliarum]
MHPGQKYDMDEYRTIYTVDENLILDKVNTPGDWIFARSNPEYGLNIPLARDPEYNLVLKIDGKPDIIIENAKHNHEYTRSDLGLSDTDQVTEILLDFTYAPAGMHAKRQVHYYFNVKPGYIGEVENRFNVRIKPDKKAIEDWNEMVENTKDKTRYRSISDSGIWWYRYNNPNTWDSLASDRHATIVPKPTNQPPIATVGVELLEHHGGQVHHGENRMKVRLQQAERAEQEDDKKEEKKAD